MCFEPFDCVAFCRVLMGMARFSKQVVNNEVSVDFSAYEASQVHCAATMPSLKTLLPSKKSTETSLLKTCLLNRTIPTKTLQKAMQSSGSKHMQRSYKTRQDHPPTCGSSCKNISVTFTTGVPIQPTIGKFPTRFQGGTQLTF